MRASALPRASKGKVDGKSARAREARNTMMFSEVLRRRKSMALLMAGTPPLFRRWVMSTLKVVGDDLKSNLMGKKVIWFNIT